MQLAVLTRLRALKVVPDPSFRDFPEGLSNLPGLRVMDLSK